MAFPSILNLCLALSEAFKFSGVGIGSLVMEVSSPLLRVI